MRDVAALAGVGVMTVSRVVNGRGGVGAERTARRSSMRSPSSGRW